jgi:hypothetical protein
MDWLLVAAPLLAEIRNVKKPPGQIPTCVYIPARGRDEPLSRTSKYAVVVRDADDECIEAACVKISTVGKGAAVEYAVNSAKCEHLAIFDSDVYFTPVDAERLAAAAGRDGVATSYRLIVGRGFWEWVAAAASDFGFVLMGLHRFLWGGAVAGRKEILAKVMRGISSAISDDMYATARARALDVPIRFIYLKLISPPPADRPLPIFKWLLRQYAIAARLGPPTVKIGLAAAAIWLVTWAIYPQTLLIYAIAGYARRKALGAPVTPIYVPAAAVAYVYTLAAITLGFFTREVEWRGRIIRLNAELPIRKLSRYIQALSRRSPRAKARLLAEIAVRSQGDVAFPIR